MLVTKEWLRTLKHLTEDHAQIFGVAYMHGWKKRVVGTEITDAQKQQLETVRPSFLSKRKLEQALRMARQRLGLPCASKGTVVTTILAQFPEATSSGVSQHLVLQWYRDKHIGTPLPVERRRKRAKPEIKRDVFLDSYEWRRLRMVVIKKRGRRCECCGATPADGVTVIHVDHIKPRKKYPELALAESNLQVLCGVCNHGKGNWDETDWRAAPPVSPEPVAVIAAAAPEVVRLPAGTAFGAIVDGFGRQHGFGGPRFKKRWQTEGGRK